MTVRHSASVEERCQSGWASRPSICTLHHHAGRKPFASPVGLHPTPEERPAIVGSPTFGADPRPSFGLALTSNLHECCTIFAGPLPQEVLQMLLQMLLSFLFVPTASDAVVVLVVLQPNSSCVYAAAPAIETAKSRDRRLICIYSESPSPMGKRKRKKAEQSFSMSQRCADHQTPLHQPLA